MTNTSTMLPAHSGYTACRLTEADLPEIMQLQADIHAHLTDKKTILVRKEAEFAQAMQAPHFVVGLRAEATTDHAPGSLAAMAVARFGADKRMPSAEVQSVFVSPDHRRKGLMGRLLEEIEDGVAQTESSFRLHCRAKTGGESGEKFLAAGYRRIGQTMRPPEVDPDGTKVDLYEKWIAPSIANVVMIPTRDRDLISPRPTRTAQAQVQRR